MSNNTHALIKEQAKVLAGEYYEIKASRDDKWFKRFGSQNLFIAREWGAFIPVARQILSQLLASNTLPQDQKEKIYEALVQERYMDNGMILKPGLIH